MMFLLEYASYAINPDEVRTSRSVASLEAVGYILAMGHFSDVVWGVLALLLSLLWGNTCDIIIGDMLSLVDAKN